MDGFYILCILFILLSGFIIPLFILVIIASFGLNIVQLPMPPEESVETLLSSMNKKDFRSASTFIFNDNIFDRISDVESYYPQVQYRKYDNVNAECLLIDVNRCRCQITFDNRGKSESLNLVLSKEWWTWKLFLTGEEIFDSDNDDMNGIISAFWGTRTRKL